METELEIHLQEGFHGETIVISVDGETVGRVRAESSFATGLAHIEPIHADKGQMLDLAIEGTGTHATLPVAPEAPFVTLNLRDGALICGATERRPGYV
ncbi:MAG: hypothetical protein AAF919_13195 [Pseudomonadota bacterium]